MRRERKEGFQWVHLTMGLESPRIGARERKFNWATNAEFSELVWSCQN